MKKITLFTAIIFLINVFTASAQFAKIHDFVGTADGTAPRGDLISDGTYLYGMTNTGGANNLGEVFKVLKDGTGYTDLLDFSGTANGSKPSGSLYYDGTFLYGMTYQGGTGNKGVIFKVKPDGTGFVKLLDFSGTANGANPYGSLVSDGAFLYGMTSAGGTNNIGVIFKIMPNGTGFLKLLDFASAANGSGPRGSLIYSALYLYGMAYTGGTSNLGTVFKIKNDGTGFLKLVNFTGAANGSTPNGSLYYDGTFLYGMTSVGGANAYGALFKVKPDATGFSLMMSFTNYSGTAGSVPIGSLITDGTFLYGMTSLGGTGACANGCGTLFKIKPDATGFARVLNFANPAYGSGPMGSLYFDGNVFYGMTSAGGANTFGTIFKYYHPLQITSAAITATSCASPCNGSATTGITFGTPPFTYSWNSVPVQTNDTATGLCPGTYTLTVTDSFGSATSTVTIAAYTATTATITTTAAACSGVCNGHATAVVTGGASPYTYSWSPGGYTIANPTTLCAGTYTLNVTDNNGCIKASTTTISTAPLMTAAFTKTNVSCFGGANGTATVNITNGTSPFSYLWDNLQTTQTATGLNAGADTVTVTDVNGCSITATTTITEPTVLTANATVVSNASCENNDGSASVTAGGGTSPYTYAWTGSGSGTATTVTGLGAGSAIVTVTDTKGCIKKDTVSINNSVAPLTPGICEVTVDALSTHNIIYWDKTTYAQSDSFRIFREVSPGVFTNIATVPYDSLSEYHDYGVNPNTSSFSYKISVKDTCGNESAAMSKYHTTIYLQNIVGGALHWNLYAIESSANPVTSYRVYRDNTNSGTYVALSTTIPQGTTSYNDVNYALYPNARYYVDVVWSISCSPTKAPVASTRSNIKPQYSSVGISESAEMKFSVFPNPANNTINISAEKELGTIIFYNTLGAEVKRISSKNKQEEVDISKLSSGIYYIHVNGGYLKIVKE